MTPGTGTSRRKRVSFGNDVKKTNDPLAINKPETQKRTRLNEALEKAQREGTQRKQANASDDEWEEEADDEDFCQHDMTVDLNEPHSQSGRYWKEEFEKYHEDARAEIGKLLKYKQLAKSYAQHKDAEAADLARQLKEEQRKVIDMEKKIAENASEIASKRGRNLDQSSPELSTLATQTALAVQYRTRVQELETQLEDFLQEREDGAEFKSRKKRPFASPRTQRTLLETQRELRKARNQVKELGDLKDQVKSLKAELKAAEQRAANTDVGKKIDSEVSQDGTRARELRAQLREVREESRKKDDELRRLKKEFEDFRKETQVRDEDTKGVLERAHNKISDLKKEVKNLKAGDPEPVSRSASSNPQTDAVKSLGDSRGTKAKENETHTRAKTSHAENPILALNEETTELNLPVINPLSLRQKFNDNATDKPSEVDGRVVKAVSTTLGERPSLGQPRWQPFVPRSPRNRGYLSNAQARRIENGGITPATMKQKEIIVPDLPALAKSIARSSKSGQDEFKIDLLEDRFARLGGPDPNNSTFLANTSKSTLPPERRAAAIARIERRMAEKKRAHRHQGFDKENVRP